MWSLILHSIHVDIPDSSVNLFFSWKSDGVTVGKACIELKHGVVFVEGDVVISDLDVSEVE